jgi:Sap, sulfolipid-1-addressing protein
VGRLLLQLLPLTILSALTPWTIVGVIVLLASKGGVRNAIAFTLGWCTAIVALGAAIILGLTRAHVEHASPTTSLRLAVQFGSGVALLLFAYLTWRKRPPRGHAVAEPGWIRRLDEIGVPLAFAFGALWINGFLVVPAALQIASADVSGAQKAFALLFYALGASSGPIAVIAYRVLAPDRAAGGLARLRSWVALNSSVSVAILLTVLGGALVVKALLEAI